MYPPMIPAGSIAGLTPEQVARLGEGINIPIGGRAGETVPPAVTQGPSLETLPGGEVAVGGAGPGPGIPGLAGGPSGEPIFQPMTITAPPGALPVPGGIQPITEGAPFNAANIPGAPGTPSGPAVAPPGGMPEAPPAAPEAPPAAPEAPPAAPEAPPVEEPPPGWAGPVPLPEARLGTVVERQIKAFDKNAQRVYEHSTPEERANIDKYSHNITQQMKSDLVSGKMSPEAFMAKTGGISLETLRSVLNGTMIGSQMLGYQKQAQ